MTSDETPDLAEAVDRLAGLVQALSVRLDVTQDMQKDLKATMDAQNTQRRVNRWLTVLMTLIVMLALVVVYVLYRVDQNADSIGDIQDRTSSQVLCPLYGLLVAQIETAPSDAADDDGDGVVTDAEQASFDATVRVIRDGYAALDCRPSS